MNRVYSSIEKTKQIIADRIEKGQTTAEKVESYRRSLDFTFDEFAAFQELKSVAMVEGKLTAEEAQLVYSYLGNTPEHFNSQSVEVKHVLTKIYVELLEKRMKAVPGPT
jgi:hypothetical protein